MDLVTASLVKRCGRRRAVDHPAFTLGQGTSDACRPRGTSFMALWVRARHLARTAEEPLGAVNLTDASRDRIRTYSGGMRQRVTLAQALIGQAPLLILDKPTSGCDPEERTRMKNPTSAYGSAATVLLSTHIVEDLENLTDSVLVIGPGRLIASESPTGAVWRPLPHTFEIVMEEGAWNSRAESWTGIDAGARPTVVSVRAQGSMVTARCLVPEAPVWDGADVQAVEPTLNDGYLWVSRSDRTS
jgi:ABC-2 type transport system ATP-binding protein